jgi:Ca2+-binding RTX toxin-like protein
MFGIFSKNSARSSKGSPAPRRLLLAVESLECRLVPTASVWIAGGHLFIAGTGAADTVKVDYMASGTLGNFIRVTGNGTYSLFKVNAVSAGDVKFWGYDGNDTFQNLTNLRAFAYGGNGSDTLIGGAKNDTLDGGNDQDYLYGMGGDDALIAGVDTSVDAVNYLYGGAGTDTLIGGRGDDWMYGEFDNDYLYGGNGNDHLEGGYGHDELYGQNGADTLLGGSGDYDNDWNLLVGGDGNDYMYGAASYDYLYGGNGSDHLYGGGQNDWLAGEDGMDYLYGQGGNDDLNGGDDAYADYLNGGADHDHFQIDVHFNSSTGHSYNADNPVDYTPGYDYLYN